MADFETTDPLGNVLRLTDETWEEHILRGDPGHPEVAPYRAEVEAALSAPSEIWSSKWHPNRLIYYRPLGRRLLVAVVADVRSGKVHTAYLFTDRPAKGGAKLWP